MNSSPSFLRASSSSSFFSVMNFSTAFSMPGPRSSIAWRTSAGRLFQVFMLMRMAVSLE